VTDHRLCPRERDEAKKQAPSKQAWQKANSKAEHLVDCRAVLLNLRTACKLKLPHLTEGEADQAAAPERQKKKETPLNHLARL
jgi:hypothetical protein